MSASRPWLGLVGFVLACEGIGASGAAFTDPRSTWYRELAKPPFQPPPWVFGPVWTMLYALMAIAAWRVWRRRREQPLARRGLILFAVQLALNAAWTPVFFGAHAIGAALGVIGALAVAVLLTGLAFRRVDRVAGGLMIPYLVWVLFATTLNAAIHVLNP